jgi:hypothetical protein
MNSIDRSPLVSGWRILALLAGAKVWRIAQNIPSDPCPVCIGATYFVPERSRVIGLGPGPRDTMVQYECDGITMPIARPGTSLDQPYAVGSVTATPASMMPAWAARVHIQVTGIVVFKPRDILTNDDACLELPMSVLPRLASHIPQAQRASALLALMHLWRQEHGIHYGFEADRIFWKVEFERLQVASADAVLAAQAA